MTRYGLAGVFIAISLLCTVSNRAATHPSDQFSEEFNRSYKVAQNVRIILENITGDVRISAWDRAEVKIGAVKRSYKQDRLSEASVMVDSTPDSIYIKTQYPYSTTTWTNDEDGKRNNPPSVEYTLFVPSNARLEKINLVNGALEITGIAGGVTATATNGRLRAQEIEGQAKLSTINGLLDVTVNQISAAQVVSLNSVNGDIVLRLSSDARATLTANTSGGSIVNDFGFTVQNRGYGSRSLSGLLGGGGASINLSNVNGGIMIRRV